MIELFQYIAIALPVTLSAIGAAIGQSLIAKSALKALYIQPHISNTISKVCIIGIALTETTGILGVVITLMLLMDPIKMQDPYYAIIASFGISIAVGLSGLVAGIASARPAQAACLSMARQPFMNNKILNLMLITQTLIMTPNIFGFLIGLLIKAKLPSAINLPICIQLFSSGLSMGVGCIGPTIGLALFAHAACQAVGFNKKAYTKIITFTFISEAIIETPLIFSLIVALTILNINSDNLSLIKSISLLAAAICIGISTLSPGFNSGKTGASACKQISYNVEQYPALSKITLLALAMIDTFAIYGLLTSMMLIFFI